MSSIFVNRKKIDFFINNMKKRGDMKLKIIILICISVMGMRADEVSFYERWWQGIVEKKPFYCHGLYGSANAESRRVFRSYLKTKNYKNILDVPSGFCAEYAGFLQDSIVIDYYGVDIAFYLVNKAREKNLCVVHGTIENI